MSIHEECGVFGVYSPERTNVAGLTYYGLYALQHRGQEGCGLRNFRGIRLPVPAAKLPGFLPDTIPAFMWLPSTAA